ncbi:rpa-associated protein [Natronomonas pharaonis DSM 2160]|uniref:Rpa-associated protein n=1 Tax=Natronomonas pharaonis (strain ATCC 35678 / DSM 2160 / CIP 103997 / JCM 8858 / NBRC 14720 / NCIMB 2260 / Gabara) TaxID=348780 RepID=A0A1U7EXZ1_NATPD|nr:hypothetical protein [Natronomonas pharaonis]CAI50072.1 rpa-associated protein [Natronomonas pharaonis DSM 2160]
MSSSGPGRREVAYRLFAAEFDDAEFSYSESDEERAPNYVVTPTGARVNRLFAVGVLTEVEDVNPEMVRGRVVDPTGAFVTYAGQYQPDELAFLERTDPPTFLALSGKARTYEPEDGDRVFTSVRPESISEVDADTRDRWVITAAERTLDRIGIVASAIEADLAGDQLRAALEADGVDERLADGVALALDHYGTTPDYLDALRELAVDAVRVVAGERDEVGRLDIAPGEGGGDATALAALDLSGAPSPETAAAAAGIGDADDAGAGVEAEPEPETETETDTEPAGASDSEPAETTGTDDALSGDGRDATGVDEPLAGSDEAATASDGPETTTPADEPTADTAERSATDALDESPTAEAAPAAGSEPGAVDTEPPSAGDAGLDESDAEADSPDDDFDPGEFDLDEEEREEIKEEFGTEFSTADEVEPADIEPEAGDGADDAEPGQESSSESEPEPEPGLEAESEPEPEVETESEPEPEVETESEPEPGVETEPEAADTGESAAADDLPGDADGETGVDDGGTADDVDLEAAVSEAMASLDDGDGAAREELVSTVADEQGVSADAVEDTIQEMLMGGRCYEPQDGVLKPI